MTLDSIQGGETVEKRSCVQDLQVWQGKNLHLVGFFHSAPTFNAACKVKRIMSDEWMRCECLLMALGCTGQENTLL